MTTGARTTALALATVALGACTGASSTSTTNVVDSAGVRIVTKLPGSVESAATGSLSTEPVVDLGAGATPDVPLHRVTAPVPLDGGRAAVGTNSPPQARVFESDGILAATLGREGEGPVEFAAVGSVVPLGADTYAASSRGTLVVGTAESPELGFYAADGPLVSGFNTWLDAQLASRAPGERAMLRQRFGTIPLPERFPAYHGIIGGDTGEVWVREYPGQLGLMGISPEVRRMPARRWLVFDADGALTAAVRTPEGFQPHAVREGRVWGVFTDELDVESVRAYDVVKG